MNVYIYDDFLNKGKYSKTINKIEIRLTDLGLNGKIIRLGSIKNARDIIQNEIKGGARNITAVGNNRTINKVISSIIDNDFYDVLRDEIIFSLIPVGSEANSIAYSLGIKDSEGACNIILARRIEKITVGEINGNDAYFLNKLEMSSRGTSLKIDSSYTIEALERGTIKIVNLPGEEEAKVKGGINPNDEYLDIILGRKIREISAIKAKSISIEHTDGPVIADESLEIPAAKHIKISRKKIRMIIGKDRKF